MAFSLISSNSLSRFLADSFLESFSPSISQPMGRIHAAATTGPERPRLNIDFAVAAGYNWGTFDEYLPVDEHYVWQATKRRRYIGPTKLEISLVWLIGCGNYNKDKGGKR